MRSRAEKNQAADEAKSELPLEHIAIIMDGNRRWAQRRMMPGAVGHQRGVTSLKKIVRHAGERSLKYLTVYAFSSENWQRSQDEVSYLMQLFSQTLDNEFAELAENQVRLRFIGDLSQMPETLVRTMNDTMEKSRDNTGLNLQVAINYGARLEITEAVKAIAARVRDGEIDIADIDEKMVSEHLYTSTIPDPELLIRTGGDLRLSNYLLWQSAYTELYVTPTLWPDFTTADFDSAIAEFARRERRYGGD
ncbi:MAG: isoprenyl transferase [Cyanobacteria bacterium]|nr:isoprenyl transferase [Cyanobacteriota bacterium]